MFGTMVDYWAYTGDTTYVNETYQALQHQVGDDNDFMPTNQTRTEGNDEYVPSLTTDNNGHSSSFSSWVILQFIM